MHSLRTRLRSVGAGVPLVAGNTSVRGLESIRLPAFRALVRMSLVLVPKQALPSCVL